MSVHWRNETVPRYSYREPDNPGEPNLFHVAEDDPAGLLKLLQAHPAAAGAQNERGETLVHFAVRYHNDDMLRLLVNDLHADVNWQDNEGMTALFEAQTLVLAHALVEELHADFTIRNAEGLTAREWLEEENGEIDVTQYLLEKETAEDAPPPRPWIPRPSPPADDELPADVEARIAKLEFLPEAERRELRQLVKPIVEMKLEGRNGVAK